MGRIKHGLINTPTYRSWRSMKMRCLVPAATSYKDYGGAGIKIYEPWLEFSNFVADMGQRPPGMTLDRIDSHGDYEPSNCRWATPAQQQRNRRTIKPTKSGYQGVYPGWRPGDWRAQIHLDNVQYDLGTFNNKEDAYMMRMAAENQLIGEGK